MICQEPLSLIDTFDVINENVHGSKSPPSYKYLIIKNK